MRLKTFSAPTTAEAMDLVRRDLGEDAIIVSTQPGGDGQSARVTAAMEDLDPIDVALPWRDDGDEPAADATAEVRQALAFHGTPALLSDRLTAAAGAFAESGALMALAGALDTEFDFAPVSDATALRRLILVGPPGRRKDHQHGQARRPGSSCRPGGGGHHQRYPPCRRYRTTRRVYPAARHRADRSGRVGRTVRSRRGNRERCQRVHRYGRYQPVQRHGDGNPGRTDPGRRRGTGSGARRRRRRSRRRRHGIRVRRTGCEPAAGHPTRRGPPVRRPAGGGRRATAGLFRRQCHPHIADGLSPINPVSLARLIMPHAEEPAATVQLNEAAL